MYIVCSKNVVLETKLLVQNIYNMILNITFYLPDLWDARIFLQNNLAHTIRIQIITHQQSELVDRGSIFLTCTSFFVFLSYSTH